MGFGAFDPESIGVAEKEWRIAENGQRLFDRAALIEQQIALVGNDDPGRAVIGEMRFDLISQMMHVDDRRADSGERKTIEKMIDHRLAADLDERLGDRLRQRPHPHAAPRRKNHRPIRH